jgi:hypothetical protein
VPLWHLKLLIKPFNLSEIMKKIHTFLCLIFMFFVTFQVYTQAPAKIWDKTFGGNLNQGCSSMIATPDGGYVIAGTSNSGIFYDKSEASKGGNDYWIIKINSSGQKVWDKTIGGNGGDGLTSIINTNDGGFLLSGNSASGISGDKTEANRGNSDYWIVKLNSLGQKVWDKTLGGDNTDLLNSTVATSEGGFIMAGVSFSGISGDKTEASKGINDIWIVKVDNLGQKVWDKTIGTSGGDNALSIITTTDGGYVVAGISDAGISGDKTEASKGDGDFWILKLNSAGAIIWDKTLGGSLNDVARSIITNSDGGYTILGTSNSGISGDKSEVNRGGNDYWVVKINASGQKVWDKTIGGDNYDEASSIISTSDGGYILAGSSQSGMSGEKSKPSKGSTDYWIVKVNSIGQKIWDKAIGSGQSDNLVAIVPTNDGGYFLAGTSDEFFTSGDKTQNNKNPTPNYWLVKVLLTCTNFTNNIAYVNYNATGSNTGLNWANAFTSLESALSATRTCTVSQIWIAKGTYKPSAYPTVITGTPALTNRDYTFELVGDIGIYGGFIGTETALTQRLPGNTTILSGDIGTIGVNSDNCYHVLFASDKITNCKLDGLTISNGNANGSLTITNIQQSLGGGFYNKSNTINISNVIFLSNNSMNGGGGMCNDNSTGAIFNNVIFSDNSSSSNGGGVYIYNSRSVSFNNAIFYNNMASSSGGGAECFLSAVSMINATFSKNKAFYSGGGILNSSSYSPLIIKNSIFSGNQINGNPSASAADIKTDGTQKPTISYTSLQLVNNATNYSTIDFPNIGTSNNIFVQNPLFVNDADPDGTDNIFMTTDDGLSLQSASPCKDAGTATGAPTTDITGAGRVGNVDMGAYEFSSSTLTTFDSATSGNWNATSTWFCSCIPNGTLPVRIMSNHIVTVPTTYIGQAKGLRFMSTGKVTLQGTGKVNVIN